ncbi:hypothetical protein E2C01_052170 [Portunus trituberculatus]|uniref:Uncharacterized protein n=1 Tax=Portunus trituberculatus TaxID=210409 RepID=A0A5B7GL73_PORTR|nr:hypothetical protein [Portunus trituberculatus]
MFHSVEGVNLVIAWFLVACQSNGAIAVLVCVCVCVCVCNSARL